MCRQLAVAAVVTLLSGAGRAAEPSQAAVPADHAQRMARGLEMFRQSVGPALARHCVDCHGGESTESNFDMTTRDGLLKGGVSGPAVAAGNAAGSLLVQLLRHQRDPAMPFGEDPLPADLIAKVELWIDDGAPYEAPLKPSAEKDEPPWTEKQVDPEARRFWSFQPFQIVEPPAAADAAWDGSPLDRFLYAAQSAAGLTPNAPADKRTLIRRVYFDLLGLPPRPDEIAAFLADSAPDAYERLVDRLLGSPHYGERWARHWLDLARFAESHGFEHDYDRPSAYHYRDFVIWALNEDLPYDQFVRWQLAGDEAAPDNIWAQKATGFLAAGVHSTQITANEVEKHRYDEMDDMLSTVGTAMLGLTVGCARCHDHKYDPIPQRDYYRLLSTFTTTVRSEIEHDVDPEGYAQAKAEFDRQHAELLARRDAYQRNELPARLAEWEQSLAAQPPAHDWVVLEFVKPSSDGGVRLVPQDDGSLLSVGKDAKIATYTLPVQTSLPRIAAVRIEALADDRLPHRGPGRGSNGNFALSELVLEHSATKQNPDAVPVPLVHPRATFEQPKLPVAAALDGNPNTGWAVDGQIGRDHAAVFDLAEPLQTEGTTRLTFRLVFNQNVQHLIGRVRVSATANTEAPIAGSAMPERILAVLNTPPARRSESQRNDLLTWFRSQDPQWLALDAEVQRHEASAPQPQVVKVLVSSEGLPALRLHSQGEDFFPETYFLRRGEVEHKQGVAPQGFLQVLMASPAAEQGWYAPPPPESRTSHRRTALANWLTDTDSGAGALLARVMVNRLWQHHLGGGIVATPSDFGTRGEPPSHPELLDWLAGELLRNDWRLKPIHRAIVTSAAYRQSSAFDPAKAAIDPENRLLWRRPRMRLEAEVIRDALLAVGGALDPSLYGPGTLDPASRRRSIYFTVKRSQLMPMMQVFDAPEPLVGVAQRPSTTVAPQALYLMNNQQMRLYASGLAQRAAADGAMGASPEEAVQAVYQCALGRPADSAERAAALAFLKQQTERYAEADRDSAAQQALVDLCHTVLCLNEFVYVD